VWLNSTRCYSVIFNNTNNKNTCRLIRCSNSDWRVQSRCIYLDLSKYGGITSYDITLCVGFFQNDDNQVNIGDPIEDIMISKYHTIHHKCILRNFAQTHVHDCMQFCKSFWPGKGSECRFSNKLQKFLGVIPKPPPCARTQGCSVSRFLLFWLTQLSDSSRAAEMPTPNIQDPLSGPHQELRGRSAHRSRPSVWSHKTPSEFSLRSHCQAFRRYASTASTPVSCWSDSRPSSRAQLEASSSSSETTDGSTSSAGTTMTHHQPWPVEKIHHEWSYRSDSMVLTTTCWRRRRQYLSYCFRWIYFATAKRKVTNRLLWHKSRIIPSWYVTCYLTTLPTVQQTRIVPSGCVMSYQTTPSILRQSCWNTDLLSHAHNKNWHSVSTSLHKILLSSRWNQTAILSHFWDTGP